jgi:hypothetical protein
MLVGRNRAGRERGTILVTVILFVAIAIAALAAISSSRVITEAEHQKVLEQESQALNGAYAQIQLALNVINTSAYTDENRNIELRDAMGGSYGGTVAGDPDAAEVWLRDPADVLHGKIRGTDVRVYRAREYIQRLAQLRGDTPVAVDTDGLSSRYYVLEAAGRSGDTVRLVSALVRENEPFSSFVFFQNRHPLGVSGAPRGLIHANDKVEFYFPDGNYVDSVSAVNGFDYKSGATTANTNLATANPEATRIDLEQVDFVKLEENANLFHGTAGLDAEIRFYGDGKVKIDQYTPPRFEDVERTWSGDVLVGYETRTVTETQQVQVGTVQEERTRQIITGYDTETYWVDVPVYETQTVTRTREDPVYEAREVEHTRQVPVYELQDATCTRWVQVFVPYNDDPGGGTAVGGGGGVAGEWVWRQEEYACQQNVLVGYTTETYTTTEQVQIGTTTVTWQEQVQVQVGTTQQQETRQVPIYGTEIYYVDVPVYETHEVEVERDFPVYETQTYTWIETVFVPPTFVDTHEFDLDDGSGVIFIDGRVTKLRGDVKGRVTLVGNESMRITGNLRYVDDEGDTAMLNGGDYTQPYVRNEAYDGNSVLGLIAREDILFTDSLPSSAEVNATLLAATGRVGIDGFQIDENGQPVADPYYGLTPEERTKEEAYDRTSYDHDRFRKESLRRLGGIISNDRILETFVQPRGDGTSYVDSGFKRGSMRFDFNLLFNPPPNFVEIPRPVVTSIAPVYLMRNYDG